MLKIKIPKEATSLRIDVGLSHNSPNLSNWVGHMSSCFVIGIEPLRECFDSSRTLLSVFPHKEHAYDYTFFIEAAVDDVASPQLGDFFIPADIRQKGCSSLKNPNPAGPLKEIGKREVVRVSLKYILDRVDWETTDIQYIEYLKTDTQGNELSVLKSLGEYLQKIVCIEIECSTGDEYTNPETEEEIIKFLEENNFQFLKNCHDSWREDIDGGRFLDKIFINKSFLHLKDFIRTDFPEDARIVGFDTGESIVCAACHHATIYMGVLDAVYRFPDLVERSQQYAGIDKLKNYFSFDKSSLEKIND